MYSKFEELLKENNVTAYAVSKATGIPSSTFSDWKKGKSKPKVEKLQKLAEFFNVSVADFLEGVDKLATTSKKEDN